MKILICGSRGINDLAVVAQAVAESGMAPTHIVSGGARGVDTLARLYAQSNGIEFTEHVADWEGHGRRAGYLRNITMMPSKQLSPSGTERAVARSIRSITPLHRGNGFLY